MDQNGKLIKNINIYYYKDNLSGITFDFKFKKN